MAISPIKLSLLSKDGDLPSLGSLITTRVTYLAFIGIIAGLLELHYIPRDVLTSLKDSSVILQSAVLLLTTYLVSGGLLGILWGLIVFFMQRVFQSTRPLRFLIYRLFPADNMGRGETRRLAALLTALVVLAAFMAGSYGAFYGLSKADFQNRVLASALSVVTVLGVAFAALLVGLPVYLFLFKLLSLLRRLPLFARYLRADVVFWGLVVLMIAAVPLLLWKGWGTVIMIKNYQAYLFGTAIAGYVLLLQSLRIKLAGRFMGAVNAGRFIWPAVFVAAFLILALVAENSKVRYVAFKKTILAGHLLTNVRQLMDFDADGYPAIMGGGDCMPFNSKVYPDALEKPGNKRDDNCVGGDRPKGLYRNTDVPYPIPADIATKMKDYNVVFISIDAVRARNVSLYGYGRDTTPNLVEWSDKKKAFIFDRAYCNVPATRWVIPQIHTSMYPSDIAWSTKTFPHTIKKGNRMLAETLKAHGYYTSAYWTMDKRMWGQDQGFDRFNNDGADKSISGDMVTDYAGRFFDFNKEKKFFLWLHYFEPHAPYVSHPGNKWGDKDLDRYDGEIRYVDQKLKIVFEKMESLGLWDKTIVILTADHGEEFLEHGKRFHSYHLYEESVHVPLVWWVPGLTGKRLPQVISHIDLMPTIQNMLQFKDGWDHFRGRSYAPLLFGDEPAYQERPAFMSISWTARYPGGSIKGVVDREYKLLYNVRSQVYELYDLKTDSLESDNIFDPDHDAVKRLMPILYHEIDEIRPNRSFN